MFAPVDNKYRVLVIYLYGRELEFETDMDVLAAETKGDKYVDLENGIRVDLTNIERIITAEE